MLIDPQLTFTPIWQLTIKHLSFHLMNYFMALQHHRNVFVCEISNNIMSIWEMNKGNLHRWSKNENYSHEKQVSD